MLEFMCREPDNALYEVSCDVEASKCLKTMHSRIVVVCESALGSSMERHWATTVKITQALAGSQ